MEFFLIKAFRKYHHALRQGLLPIASALFGRKCNQTKLVISESAKIFFSFIKAPFDDLNAHGTKIYVISKCVDIY